MSTSATTTIRIERGLRRRLAAAAARQETSPHAFVLEAIARSVEESEADQQLDRLADARWDRILASGKTVAWETGRKYLLARASGRAPRKPSARRPQR